MTSKHWPAPQQPEQHGPAPILPPAPPANSYSTCIAHELSPPAANAQAARHSASQVVLGAQVLADVALVEHDHAAGVHLAALAGGLCGHAKACRRPASALTRLHVHAGALVLQVQVL